MLDKERADHLRIFSFLFLFLILLISCSAGKNERMPTAIAEITITATASAASTPSMTSLPTLLATAPLSMDTPTRSATLTSTASPTVTSAPTRTQIPLPIEPMIPFATVTPDYIEYETKSVFLSYGGYGGDGGSYIDDYYGRSTPTLIIYGDGQTLIREGVYGESITFLEATLSPDEMCTLRQQIEATGFLEPHDEFFTERSGGAGAGVVGILVENTVYYFYGPDVEYLVEDLANGFELIRNYRPARSLTPYSPEYLRLWVEEVTLDDQMKPISWPSTLPALEELWTDREQHVVLVEGEWIDPIFDLFSQELMQIVFQEGDTIYSVIARPLLPHETPRGIGYWPGLPRDYVPVLNCGGDPTLLSPDLSTATPTLTAPVTGLSGVGRIAFVSGEYDELEIYVINADGTSRLRLTNNLFIDSEPSWSPDGQRVVFVSERYGNADIFVMNADGGNVKQLTDHEAADYSPTWSPDGSTIVFVSNRDGGWKRSELYRMNTDGTAQERLTDNRHRDLLPVWSPDGQEIAFVKETIILRAQTLAFLDLGRVEPVEEWLSFRTRYLAAPAWSRDSTQIAISTASDLVEPTILIVDLEGTHIQSFDVRPLEHPRSLNWSGDGNYIVFVARQPNVGENAIHFSEDIWYPGSWNIFALDMRTEEIVQITFTEQDERSPALWP